MWLGCKVCKEMVLLAKYYPSTFWYGYHNDNTVNNFISTHEHEEVHKNEEMFELLYETQDTWDYDDINRVGNKKYKIL